MRAFLNKTRRNAHWVFASAVSILVFSSECPAQNERVAYYLRVSISNHTRHAIDPGEMKLFSVRGDVTQFVDSERTAEEVAAGGNSAETYYLDPAYNGRRYVMTFAANCADDSSKSIEFRSVPFEFDPSQPWVELRIFSRDVKPRPAPKGDLVRVKLSTVKAGANSVDSEDNLHDGVLPPGTVYPEKYEIHARPGDLIELDYLFVGSFHPTVTPKGGANPNVVNVSPIGPRTLLGYDQRYGVACFFEAKSRGHDWVSIEIDGHPRRYEIWVGEK
jgi:hypothetical protein